MTDSLPFYSHDMEDLALYLQSHNPFYPDCAIIKPSSARCNIKCDYCFYLPKKKIYPGSDCVMSPATLEEFTKQFLALQKNEAAIVFQGGEPLLRDIGFYEKAIEYQVRHNKNKVKICNALQTNGTLLNDQWCEFFKRNHILVGVSLDGPKTLHDHFRKDTAGKGTFDRVVHGIRLLQKHKADYNILATVHAGNAAYPLECYRFFRDAIGAEYLQFIPVVNRNNDMLYQVGTEVRPESVQPHAYGLFLSTIFNEWVKRDVARVFVQIFDTTLANYLQVPGGLCTHAECCGRAIAVEHNGDIYPCDHYVDPARLLGNIRETSLSSMVNCRRQRMFGADKRDSLPRQCHVCEHYPVCHGECPKNRTKTTNEAGRPLNYLCEGLKLFFSHTRPAMEVMAKLLREEKPPALIMKMIRDT